MFTPAGKPERPLVYKSTHPVDSINSRASHKRTLWWLVTGTMLVIVVLWLALAGIHLSRTATGDESLYARIKNEIRAVFYDRPSSAATNETLSNQELTNLENRVFPNVNVQDSGTFTIE